MPKIVLKVLETAKNENNIIFKKEFREKKKSHFMI